MGDILDDIGRRPGRSQKVSPTSDYSTNDADVELIKQLEKLEREKNERLHEEQMDNAKKQAKTLEKLDRAGLKITQAERMKIIAQTNKEDQNQKIKDLIAFRKRDAELQRENNKLILDADSGASLKQRMEAIKSETKANIKEQFSLAGMMNSAQKLFNNLTKEFSSIMSEYAKYQLSINTRLQGVDKSFEDMTTTLKNSVGTQPYIKTQTMFENLNKLTELGIVYNLEQRAFLETVADNISTTFNATNATLLRIVKLQQSDSTAARLGLETALTQYLNRMFEDSSYLNSNFETVSGALLEATSQMTNSATIQFEYIVQKWLGSLGSVGLSDSTISSLAQAIGYLGSGNISGLESMGGMRNLLVMASSRSSNLNYADMLTQGINDSQTNELLYNVVEYLQEIAQTRNKVVKAQYADLFGLSLSDLTAVQNLGGSLEDIFASALSYSGAINELSRSMKTMGTRMSVATRMDNIWSNLQYGLATNIAESPALYGIWKVTDMIKELTGGIEIPFITALGSGVDVKSSVDELMKLGIVGVSSLGMIGDIVAGITNTIDASKMLDKLSIGLSAGMTTRGSSETFRRAPKGLKKGTSSSTYIGTTAGEDIYESTLSQSEMGAQEKLSQKQAETTDYTKITATYFTDTFDPKMNTVLDNLNKFDSRSSRMSDKMDAMLIMLTRSASYNVSSVEEELPALDLGSLIFGTETKITVTEDTTEATRRLDIINSIDASVKQILSALTSGISVNVSNMPFNGNW